MRAWRLRQPSAELRSRIFAAEPAPEVALIRPLDWPAFTRWLVPAMGCFLLATATLRERPVRAAGPMGDLSTQMLAFSMGSALEHNNIPATTLEWTFGRPSTSSSDSFIRTVTNTLSK